MVRYGGQARGGRAVLAAAMVAALVVPVGAEVIPVPESIRTLTKPREEVHSLRTEEGGVHLGTQRYRAERRGTRLELTIRTTFVDGERWLERATMDLTDGYRARTFRKEARRGGTLLATNSVDFGTGLAVWTDGAERAERRFTFSPDTYTGSMLGVVLADVARRATGAAAFQVLTFRPEPELYTVQASVTETGIFRAPGVAQPATKVRVRADLGAVQNVVFASLIPTHHFWFTRATPPEFFAFEGSLGDERPDLVMVRDPLGSDRVVAVR